MSIFIIGGGESCSRLNSGNVKKLGMLQHQRFDNTDRILTTQSQQIRELDSSQNALHMESHVYLRTIETLTRRSTATIENTITSAVAASQKVLDSKMDSLDHRFHSSDFVTKQFFSSEIDRIQGQLTQVVRGIAPNNSQPVYTAVSKTQSTARKSVSVCFDSWKGYRLPIGHIQVSTGSKIVQKGSGTNSASGWGFGVQFEFFPAPWLSNESMVASFRYYQEKSRIIICRPRMDCFATVPANRQACIAVENDDVELLQSLFSSRSAMPQDRDEHGWTLLHVSDFFAQVLALHRHWGQLRG